METYFCSKSWKLIKSAAHPSSDDWNSERQTSVYFLAEAVNIEASVDHHPLPLRAVREQLCGHSDPDVNSYPRYPTIDHQEWVFNVHSSSST